MELRELRCFVAACELQSVSAAARQVGRVQPAVSNALGRLEAELGMSLLRRHSSGVEPTPAGLAFLRHAQTILGAVDRAADEMATLRTGPSADGGPRGEVRLGIAAPAPAGAVTDLLRTLDRAAPGIEVQVAERPETTVLDQVETRELDLALLWLPVRRDAVEVEALQVFALAAVTAPDRRPGASLLPPADRGQQGYGSGDALAEPGQRRSGPVEAPTAMALRDLASEPWIAFPKGTVPRLWLDAAFLRAGGAPRIVREVRGWTECRAALEAGLGACLLPIACADDELAAGRLAATPVADAGHAILGVVRRANASATAAEDHVQAALQRLANAPAPAVGAPTTLTGAVPHMARRTAAAKPAASAWSATHA